MPVCVGTSPPIHMVADSEALEFTSAENCQDHAISRTRSPIRCPSCEQNLSQVRSSSHTGVILSQNANLVSTPSCVTCGDASLYKVCLKQYEISTMIGTWLLVLVWLITVLFAAVALTGIISSYGSTYGYNRLFLGYLLAVIFLLVIMSGFILSVLRLFSWIWTGRFLVVP